MKTSKFDICNLQAYKIPLEKLNYVTGGTDPIGSEEDDFKWQEDQE
jgi:hypothetical protein